MTLGYNVSILSSYGFIGSKQFNTAGECWITLPDSPYCYTREEIVSIFSKDKFSDIYELVKYRRDNAILDSLANLYLSVNVPSPTTQLLGAVTSIEILLKSDSNERYTKISDRLKAIFGEVIYKDFIKPGEGNIGIIDKRHKVIHEGDLCTENDAYMAIVIACYTIIAYSHFKRTFNKKSIICKHIDFVKRIETDSELLFDFSEIHKYWDENKFDLSMIDWIVQKLVSMQGLCHQDNKEISKDKYVETVLWLSKLRKYDTETSFMQIKQSIYYNQIPFENIEDFNSYYEDNKIKIDERVNKLKNRIKFKL